MAVEKSCCAKHRTLLLEESVGFALLVLADINFFQCGDCRLTDNSEPTVDRPVPSLDDFFHEYTAAVSAKSSKRFLSVFTETQRPGKHSSCDIEKLEVADDDDDEDNDAHATDDDNKEHLPHHMQSSDSVLSHLPLADVIRVRYVSRDWMSTIDAALQNPRSEVHAYIRHPCLMLLHPGSERTGTFAALSVFEFSHNVWLPKVILFPSNASYLVGTSHGLFCFATENPSRIASYRNGPLKTNISSMNRSVDFFVGNPLTQRWTCLPRPPSPNWVCSCVEEAALFAFVAYGNPNSPCSLSYKLIKVQCRREMKHLSSIFYIYDSCTRRWERHRFSVVGIQQIVYDSPGLLHCFGKCGKLLCSYNVMAETMTMHQPQNSYLAVSQGGLYGLPSVIQCAGRSFGVCRMQHTEYEPPFFGMIPLVIHKWPIGIYRLGGHAQWELASEMPSTLLKEAVEDGSDGTDFVVGSDHTRRIFLILKGSSRMVVFDVLSFKWDTLPGCTYVQTFYPYKTHAFVEPLV